MDPRNQKDKKWYEVENVGDIPSPALLLYPERIEINIRLMLVIAGSPQRLRPHVKTHKMGEIIRLQIKQGIEKFKCSTIAEVELAADHGATDILLAYQPVGPGLSRFLTLQKKFSGVRFSTIIDSEKVLQQISEASRSAEVETTVFLDINNGMNRTGMAPGEEAVRLYQTLCHLPSVKAGGLHVYDGHIRESDPHRRSTICNAAFEPVLALLRELENLGLPVPVIVAGGTPTFPLHAGRERVEVSPGTVLLYDEGYHASYADLPFLPAALLLTRIVSKPGNRLLCLDLGHKAVGSEMPHPRVKLLGLDPLRVTNHSEEHLVIECEQDDRWSVGDPVYGIPTHICSTVARYPSAWVIRNHQAVCEWAIEAQNRKITI